MVAQFDAGYRRPYSTLVASAPGEDVYPPDSFRTEWGPIFHRGRLDGSARVLLIGQDPATHETICRRILVGEAGQRAQGLLAKLGITRSYVLVNAFLYSVFGQHGGTRHIDNPAITAYRNRWLDTIARRNDLQAIITFGRLADRALADVEGDARRRGVPGRPRQRHPPDVPRVGEQLRAADQGGGDGAPVRVVERRAHRRCSPWSRPTRSGRSCCTATTITKADLAPIPDEDLPPGLPPWMRSLDAWAVRRGEDAQGKRANITITIPRAARTWPALG